ncbi:precorrin-8X methylmutase [Desulfovibrio sp. OttesenSCG-928-G15]|nr:precorrin-8X methylmutase [Desulfovibrio sp. OttesenSCG-928-G15]
MANSNNVFNANLAACCNGLDPASTPEDIEKRSFAIIDAEVGEPRPFSGAAWEVARRLVHTCGDLGLLADLHLPQAAVQAGISALAKGATVYTDTEMAKAGMPQRRLAPMGVQVVCMLSLVEKAAAGSTRSRAGVLQAGRALGGSIVAIGNAPTALLALLEYMDAGGPPPALVIAMPVGFVNAAESKELLVQRPDIPALVIHGRRGGSAFAAATVNALAILAAKAQ